jgi:hypothetical protein
MFWTRVGHGLAAGAAGTTVLNAITYQPTPAVTDGSGLDVSG